MNSVELSIKAYIQARKRLDVGYENYIARCVAEGESAVLLSEDVEPFAALNESIFWAISLYEQKVSAPDGFISGLKYVSNAMKHSDNEFPIYSFCRPGIDIQVKATDGAGGPIIEDVVLKPTLMFGGLENVSFKDRPKHKPNYLQWIHEKPIPDVMNKLDGILQQMYPSPLWDEGCQ